MKLDCPGCGKDLWAIRRGEHTLANRVVKLGPGNTVVAVCPTCAAEVAVPFLRFVGEAEPVRRRFVVRAKLDSSTAP